MDRTEFENKLLVLGSDLERWPNADADAAKRLLAIDRESRELLASSASIEAAVRQATAVPLDAAFVGRIMAATRTSPASQKSSNRFWRLFPAGTLAVLLVSAIGFKAGYDDGFGHAEEFDLATIITGDTYDQGQLP